MYRAKVQESSSSSIAEMHPHHAFFEDAASVCVEHIMVLAPKERLSEPRGWARNKTG